MNIEYFSPIKVYSSNEEVDVQLREMEHLISEKR